MAEELEQALDSYNQCMVELEFILNSYNEYMESVE